MSVGPGSSGAKSETQHNKTEHNETEHNDNDVSFRALTEVRRSAAKTRRLSSSQMDALLIMAGGLRVNLLLRGPVGTGKRWIARHIARTLTLLGENVEFVSKFFTVLPQGQVVIDAAALPLALAQLQRASLIVIDHVPPQPQAASMFFAHLDLLCRIVRCPGVPAPLVSKSSSSTTPSTTIPSLSSSSTSSSPAASDDTPEQLAFGGLQLLTTQNTSDAQNVQSEVAWHRSVDANSLTSGVVINNAPASTASTISGSPHDSLRIVVFQ